MTYKNVYYKKFIWKIIYLVILFVKCVFWQILNEMGENLNLYTKDDYEIFKRILFDFFNEKDFTFNEFICKI